MRIPHANCLPEETLGDMHELETAKSLKKTKRESRINLVLVLRMAEIFVRAEKNY